MGHLVGGLGYERHGELCCRLLEVAVHDIQAGQEEGVVGEAVHICCKTQRQ